MKHPAAFATLIASVLFLGCDAELDRAEHFESTLQGADTPGFSLTESEHRPNFHVLFEADVESRAFNDAKVEFSRIELGRCTEFRDDACASMDWTLIGAAHLRLGELNGLTRLISASQVDLGEYDELRFTVASGWAYTDDASEPLDVVTESVVVPLDVEIAAERRVDVRVLFDAPASIQYDVDDGWTLDASLVLEDIAESAVR